MARDRLAAMRAQQTAGDYSSNNSYPTQRSGHDGGYPRRQNPYAQQDENPSYEMSDVNPSTAHLTTSMVADTMAAFYDEISSIQESIKLFNDNISRISDLHARSLNNTDDATAMRNTEQLEELVNETSALSSTLKRRIKGLERQGGSAREAQIKRQQTALVKSKFVEAIQNYQQVEQQYRQKYKQRMERQFKIVKPDATPEEVRAVVEDNQGGQIFSQALMNSNRYGESRAAYREVQERHEDIKRIERTIAELAQLFNDMSIMVEQQDEAIDNIQAQAMEVEKDVETGLGYTEKAVGSARAARRKRWICFIIFLIVLAIVGIVVGIQVANHKK
ncbi:t-SNARE [Multifurca ochricompacta]|uniref:t-SNARE n=1 Tax=Multifurca ochricompacta TaxID=376703 RepID=A0AAD4MAL2_9AGAM|nr:t-SNARE [Multifurca ochricompacta]